MNCNSLFSDIIILSVFGALAILFSKALEQAVLTAAWWFAPACERAILTFIFG
jgi:hypothetical protein